MFKIRVDELLRDVASDDQCLGDGLTLGNQPRQVVAGRKEAALLECLDLNCDQHFFHGPSGMPRMQGDYSKRPSGRHHGVSRSACPWTDSGLVDRRVRAEGLQAALDGVEEGERLGAVQDAMVEG